MMVRKRTCTVLLAVAIVVNSYPQDNQCKDVRQFFVGLDIVPEKDIPLTPVTGSSNGYCEASSVCCTEQMESELIAVSERNFRLALQASSASFRDILENSADSIQAELVRSIRLATNKTQTMFSHLYEQVAGIAREPIEKFFAELESSLTDVGDQPEASVTDVESVVTNFFDDLYPKIYSHSHNGVVVGSSDAQKEFADEFAVCMKGAMSEIRPFGEMPKKIAATVTRSVEAARGLISAVRLSTEALNSTDNVSFSPECRASLLKSSYCAQCAGVENGTVKWCRGLCMNVARGCLASLMDVDKSWNELMDVLTRIISGVEGGQISLIDVMNSLDSRLSEAVLYALESGIMFDSKIKSICGPPQFKDVEVKMEKPASPPVLPEVKEETAGFSRLHALLQTLLLAVSEAKGFYANVADFICSSKNQVLPPSEEDTNCWNGSQIGEYSKTIGGIGLAEQKYNPEVRILDTAVDPVIAQLTNKLHDVRQDLASKLIVTQDLDTFLLSDQGSGSGYEDDDSISEGVEVERGYQTGEPDDDFEGSGGSGDDEDTEGRTDEGPVTKKPGTQNSDISFEPTTKKPTSGAGSSVLSLTLLMVSVLIARWQDLGL